MGSFNYINSNKFKNNSILLAMPFDLSEKTTGLNILCQVLKRGTETFDSQAKLSKELQDMYGASVEMAVSKRGDRTLLIFYVTYLKKKFTFDNTDLFKRAVNLLHEIIYNPMLENGSFRKEIVRQETENQKRFLQSEMDEKKTYCNLRAWEEIIGRPYSVAEYGRLEDIDKIDNEYLMNLYKEMLKKECIMYFMGDVNPNDYKEFLDEKLPILKNGSFKEKVTRIKNNDFVSDFVQADNVSQAKVTMLFNINTDIHSEKYYAGILFNHLYGGGATSLLFNEIREKRSLCYYIASGVDFFSGTMTVIMGVDSDKVDEAKSLTLKLLQDMKEGRFDKNKIENAKKSTLKNKMQIEDSQFNTSMTKITSFIYDYDNSYKAAIPQINEISFEDIVDFANKIQYLGSYSIVKGDK